MTRDATTDVLRLMASHGLTLGVAESLTGGALAAELIRPAGASAVVIGAIVAYATPLKERLLGVDAGLLTREGPVHADVAMQMAEGIRSAVAVDGVRADFGVATTGVAGPDAQGGRAAGTVFIAVAGGPTPIVREYAFTGDRDAIRRASVDAAIAQLTDSVSNSASRE